MKIVVKIFNVVYLIFAAVAITCFFTRPYISIDGSYELTTQQVADLLPEDVKEQVTEEELAQALVIKDDKGNEVPFAVPVKLTINSSMVLKFWDKETINNDINATIEQTVGTVVSELEQPIHNLAVIIAKKTANKAIHDNILTEVKNALGGTDEEAAQKMEDSGINEAYINDFTEDVYEKLSEEGATFDNICEIVDEKMYDVAEKLGIPEFDPETATEEINEQLDKALTEAGLKNPDGTLNNIDEAITTLLLKFLNGEEVANLNGEDKSDDATETGNSEDPEEEKEKSIKRNPLQVLAEDNSSTEEKERELTEKITNLIKQKVEELHIAETYSQYSFIAFAFTCFLILPWAILAIVSIIRILRPKKCWIRPWFVFTFAFIQVLLGVGLTLLTTFFLPQAANILPLAEYADVIDRMSISVQTSSFIPSIFYLIMIPMGIVYAVFRHKVKKQYKADKAARKAEKKAAKAA